FNYESTDPFTAK
nr:Chain B, Rab11-FIP2 DPF peptide FNYESTDPFTAK [synthetic construct]